MAQTIHPADSALRAIPSGHGLRRSAPAGTAYYEPLLRVSFRHPYYNRLGDACPDLVARPTAATQKLMHAIGLLFRADGTSFSVLYDRSRSDALLSYLQRRGGTDGFWTRMSFVLSSLSATFINATEIPIDLDPLQQNFYLSNRQAHLDPEIGVLLNPDETVSADLLLRLTGPQYPARVSSDVLGVIVRDIAGEVVLCEPRCIPEHQTAPLAKCLSWMSDLPPVTSDRCRDTIYLDFGSLPEDKYTIATIDALAEVIKDDVRLYTAEAPAPLAFLDLMFSRPDDEAGGIYPVTDLTGDGVAIAGVDYVVNFDARSTYWRYYIVPQDPAVAFDDLAIECLWPDPTPTFAGPFAVTIATGATAFLFVSEQPLLLQQQSIYRFRLKGRRSHRRLDDDTLVDRLPVAAPQQVLPETDPAGVTRNYSDIYVYV